MLFSATFWTVLIVLQAFWLLGLLAAWSIGMHTAPAMQQSGHPTGIPYLWHFGMWADVFLIHPTCAYLAAHFGSLWLLRPVWLLAAIPIGLGVSLALHWIWLRGNSVESQMIHGKLTVAGFVHIPHASIIAAIFFLFLLTYMAGYATTKTFGLMLGVLAIHAIIGTHIPLRLLNKPWFPG